MNLKFYSLTFGALMLGMMASCSNDVENAAPSDPDAATMKVAQNPDLYVYSGDAVLVNTFGTKAEAEEGNKTDKYDQKEVEINLSLNDVHFNEAGDKKYDVEDLISKLSIHVRTASDVQVMLPVPESVYCDQDDFALIGNHVDLPFENIENSKTTFNVGGNNVVLNVNFVSAAEDTENAEGYILITTEGITEEVITYCKETYEDGLNIEVYNYYKGNDESDWNVGTVKGYLNQSTVSFDNSDVVEYYINAFTQDEEDKVNESDCKVVPANPELFFEPETGIHHNGSECNEIYVKFVPVPVY